MRLIDADALKKDIARLHVLNDEAEIRRAYEYNPHVTSTDFEETLVSVFDAIDDAPSIDIVFCKDCKKTKDDFIKGDKLVWCGKWKTVMGVNEFCSRGKRSTDE